MKSLPYLIGLALIFWMGIYSMFGLISTVLLMLIGGLVLIGIFYKLLDKTR